MQYVRGLNLENGNDDGFDLSVLEKVFRDVASAAGGRMENLNACLRCDRASLFARFPKGRPRGKACCGSKHVLR